METQEKKQVLKVASILGQLASAWGDLPNDLRESVASDLVLISGLSFKELSLRLTNMTKGYSGNCEHCGKFFKSQNKGSKQRFCSTSCRVMGHREKKYQDYEAKKAKAESWEIDTAINALQEIS